MAIYGDIHPKTTRKWAAGGPNHQAAGIDVKAMASLNSQMLGVAPPSSISTELPQTSHKAPMERVKAWAASVGYIAQRSEAA